MIWILEYMDGTYTLIIKCMEVGSVQLPFIFTVINHIISAWQYHANTIYRMSADECNGFTTISETVINSV